MVHDRDRVKICPICTQAFGPSDLRCPSDGVALVSIETGVGVAGSRAADLTGQVIDGRYRVESVIGRGGMGLVYACRHLVVGKRVAMKVLKPGIERTEDVLARFIREAQAANAVRSPHIAEASDFGQLPSGHFYVIMELLEGRSFASALKERILTRDHLLYVFTQIAETLEETHRAGIVHRDLKPDNVYLVRDPASQSETGPPLYVKLLDFGVAKVLGASESNLTQSGVILGTPYYMAPEQARGQPIDHRADIYSMGVMMYHAFTGRLPFVADSAVAVLTAHAIESPAPPSQVSSVDPGVERTILRCMEKRPADRFASMHEVADDLRNLRKLAGGNMLPPAPYGPLGRVDTEAGASLSGPYTGSPVASAAVAPIEPASPRALLFALGAVAMLMLGGLAAVALIVRRPPSSTERSPSSAIAVATSPSVPLDGASSPQRAAPLAPSTLAAAASVSSSETSSSAAASGPSATPTPSASAIASSEPSKLVTNGNPTTWKPTPTALPTNGGLSPELVNPFHH